MEAEIVEESAPRIVASTEAIKAFRQVMLCLETDDGETHVFSMAPIRVKWLIAQLEGAIMNPDDAAAAA